MWDKRYTTNEYVYGKEPNDFLRESAAYLPQGRVLSIAEGEGRNAVFLAKKGYDVTGVDSSRVGLEKANRLAAENAVSIKTIHADLSRYPIGDGDWNGIVSIFCHLPSAQRAGLFKSIVKGLKPGGVFIMEAYSPRQPAYNTGGPGEFDRLVPLEEAKMELAGLEFIVAEERERHIQEGTCHNGLGHVVQIIGRKQGGPPPAL